MTTFSGGEQSLAAPTRSSYTSPQTPTYGGWPGSVDFSLTSSQCVRHAAGAQCAPAPADATSSAATTTSNLYLTYFGAALGDLLGVVNPVKVSVSCRPGQLLAPSPTGAVRFRHSAVVWESVAVPTQPGQTSTGEGPARQLSIVWNVAHTATSIRSELIMTWTQPYVFPATPEVNLRNVVLARAECGTAGQPPPLSAPSALSSRKVAQATCPVVVPAGDEEMAAPNTTTTRVTTTGTPTATPAPPAGDADGDTPVDDGTAECGGTDPTASTADPSPTGTPTSTPSPDETDSTTITSDTAEALPVRPPPEGAADIEEPAPPLMVPDGPTTPSPGEEFALVSTDGADLGAARIDEVLIDQSCNTSPAVTVVVRMTVTPSTHTGEYALDGVESSQFSQGSGSGTPISRWGQPCGSLGQTLSSLTPGRTAVGWVIFEVPDPVSPVLWQPNGTAGWLISLPILSVSPSETPLPSPTSELPTSPSASMPSVSPAPEQSEGSDKETPGSTEPGE
ncbi:hypothetical protein [Williamsia sp. DF01-3]|uniref:hypothetical protein n=1 Tax=Williamsia sp. DF01-3 TaxID=2934157 RepID=UPI001FF4A9C8|nr:hypothetical protein [Williamsia sp. DF01-3]MCK0519619.1 hypothetical protein [Williamsia sp. DF01-3]